MMESLLKRIENNRKAHSRWVALVLCLSMLVSLGTFAGFRQKAVAKTYTKEVLDCPYTHEGAEPVAHVHNDDCYDGEVLVCTLPEIEAHTHTEECFAEQRTLTCTLAENPGHQHGDACYMAREENVCGLEENPGHVHNGTCFNDSGVLICTMAEGDGAHTHTADCFTTVYDLVCEIPEGEGAHTHTDECYSTERVMICDKQELPVHVHGAECIRTEEITVDEPEETAAPEEKTIPEMPVSDPNADLETASDWEQDFENLELSGNWARDLILVAATQQGRGESPNNFEAILNDAGDAWVTHGYTRYGAWYGVPYAEEWSAMFVSFCLRYAGIPAENVPNNPTAAFMAESFQKGELFAGPDYVPAVGDLIFFDTVDDEITNIDHMGIVYHVDAEDGTINTVEGDRTNAVATFGYHLDDEQIAGYGILPQNPDYVPTEEENNNDELENLIVTTEQITETTVPAVPMPAQSWERTAGGIKVSVEAPEGAFPENTKIAVTPVNGNSLKDTVSDAVNGEVLEVQAVDITFFDTEGHEIEPAVPIRVSMTPAATEHAEEKTSVVHVDIAQQTAELVEQAVGTEFDNSEVVFDADAFTIYAIVYTYQVEYEYEVDGKTFTSSMPGAENMTLTQIVEGLGIVDEAEIDTFVSKIDSIASTNEEVAVVTENSEIRVLKDGEAKIVITMQDGAKFHIDVRAEGETSASNKTATVSTKGDLYLPADAELKAEVLDEVKSESAIAAVEAQEGTADSNAAAAETAYQVFDISLENVEADQYNGFQVEVKLPEGVVGKNFRLYHVHDGKVDELELNNVDSDGEPVLLESVSFVTPSFSEFVLSYTVDFEYEVDGQVYQFSMEGGSSMLLSELIEILHVNTKALSFDKFMTKIADVTFSTPSLVEVVKMENDWLLKSLQPFDSQEMLTITMADSQQFVIQVSDAAQSNDLTSFITSVNIDAPLGEDGKYEVRKGKPVTIDLRFKEKSNLQFDLTTMYYPIPAGLDAMEGAKGFLTITAEDGGVNYTIDGNEYEVKDGVLILKWNTEHPDFEHLSASSNTEITLHISAALDGSENTIHFGSDIDKQFNITDPHGVTVKKTAGTVNKETGEVDYLVTVTSTGDNTNIVVTDSIPSSSKALSYKTGSVHVYSNQYDRRNETLVPGVNVTSESNSGFSLTIPSMSDGETYAVAYKGQVDLSKLTRNADGSYGIDADTMNNATAKPDNYPSDSSSNSLHTIYVKPSVSKNGGNPSDVVDGKRTVEWTLKATSVNTADGQSSLAGGWIKDTISDASIPGTDKTSQNLMKYTGAGIKIVITNEQNQVVDTREVSWQDLGVNPETATSWTYNVPSTGVDKDTPGTLTYTVTYKTEVDVSETISSVEVINDGDSSEADPSTGKKTVDPIEENQAGVDKKVTAANTQEISWEVELTVPATGLTVARVEDVFPASYNNQYDSFKTGSLVVSGQLTDQNGVTETYAVDNSDPTKMVITFSYTDTNGTHTGLYGTGEQRTIKLNFTTTNNQEWIQSVETGGKRDHENWVAFTANQKVFTDTARAVPTIEQKVTKKAQNNGLPTDTVTVNGAKLPVWTYELVLEGVLPDSEIVDIFDSRLEFVPFATVNFGQSTSQPGVLYGGTTANDMQSYVGNYINPGSQLDGYVDYSVNGNTVTFHIDEQNIPQFAYNDGTSNIENTYFKLIYQLRAKDEAALEQLIAEAAQQSDYILKTIHNTASFGPSTSEQDVKYEFNPVDKEMVNDAEIGGLNNVGKFRIIVNPSGLDLNPSGDYITMTDNLVENLSIYYNTIQASPAEGVKWVASGDAFTFTIPDATPVTITYDALIIGTGSVHIRNVASIDEKTSIIDTTKTVQAKAEGSSSNPSISILKHKEGDMTTTVQGAVFGLYQYTGDWKGEDGLIKSDFSADNTKWEEVKDGDGNPVQFTTNENGVATFRGDANKLGWTLNEMDTLYALHEIQAPAGYQLKTTYYRFVMSDSGIPDYDHYIYFSGDTMRVGNNPEPGITIEKAVTGIELTEEQKQAITFEVTDPAGTKTTLTFAQFVNGEYRITDDNFKAGTYTITEKTSPPEHYALNTSISGAGTGSSVTTENGQIVASTSVTVNDLSKDFTVSFLNKYSSTSINVVKLGEKNDYLAGAEFQLVKINTETDAEEEIATKTSLATATGIQFSPLQDGEYILREITPPEGYIALASDMRFSVVDGKVTWHGENRPSGSVSYKPSSSTVTVVNRKDTEIEVHKVWAGEDGKTTPVTMKLYRTHLPIQLKTVDYRDNQTVFGQVTAPIGATIRVHYVTETGERAQQDFTLKNDTSQVHIGQNNISDVHLEIILPDEIENSKKLVETKDTANNTAIFNGLDRADPSGKKYSYWVEEETPTGRYIVSYENNLVTHDSLSNVITVTNTPEEEQDGLIEVEKVWKNTHGDQISDTSALPEITLQLKAKQDESPVTIHVVNEYNPNQEYCIASGDEIHLGDSVKVTLRHSSYVATVSVRAGNTNGEEIVSQNGNAGTSQSIIFTVTNTAIYIRVNSGDGLTASVSRNEAGSGAAVKLPDPVTITLNNSNRYYWNSEEHPEVILDTSKYAYYVEEESVPVGYEVSYSNNNEAGVTKGKLTVTNTESTPQTGSVMITKNFTGITADQIPAEFKITATWGEEPDTTSKELTVTGELPENVIRTGEFPSYTWEISDLPVDTVVTFTETGYDVDGYSVTVNGTATAESSTATAASTPGEASFVNTYTPKAHVEAEKVFTNGTIAENQFSFTISAASGTPLPETKTVYAGTDGKVVFGDMSYPASLFDGVTAGDDGKKTITYTYTVAEVLPKGVNAENPIKDGIRYDTEPKTVEITAAYDPATGAITVNPATATVSTSFTNEQLGALKLTKAVTVNGLAPTDANKAMTNGIYEFTIHSVADADNTSNDITVKIKFEDGKATKYQIGSGEAQTVTGTDNTWSVVIPNLTAGVYTITEAEPENGTTLARIERGDQSSSSGETEHQNAGEGGQVSADEEATNPVDLTKRKVTVHVTAGDTTAAQVTFTNNVDTGYLQIDKSVTYNGETVPDNKKSDLAGTYTFKVYTDKDCSVPYKVYQEQTERDLTLTVTIGNDGAPKSSDPIELPVGDYWIEEQTPSQMGVTPDVNRIHVAVTKGSTTSSPAKADFVNNKDESNNPDEQAIELEKKFTGITDASQIPSNFHVTLSYKVLGAGTPVSVTLNSSTEGYVTCVKSNNDLIWHWRITHIPSAATDFSVSESNYDIDGYTRVTTINGQTIADPSSPEGITVLQPEITMVNFWSDYTTSDKRKVFPVTGQQILLVRSTQGATIVVSRKSLSMATRKAIEDLIINNSGKIPGDPDANASWDTTFVYFSREIQGDSFSYGGRTIYFKEDNVEVPHNASSHEVRVEVNYVSETAQNSFVLVNDYSNIPVEVDLLKVEKGKETSTQLADAVFELRKLEDMAPTSSGTLAYVKDNDNKVIVTSKFTDKNGRLSFDGLTRGIYEIREKSAPTGYVLSEEVVFYMKVEAGTISYVEKGTGKPSTWGAAANDNGVIKFTAAQAATEDTAAANAQFRVANTPGTALPNTGGIGTTLFTALGGLMTATAGAILTMKRKRKTA